MRLSTRLLAMLFTLGVLTSAPARADNYSDTIENFRTALGGEFFDNAYGYAVFPTIGKGGMGVGGAHGKGRVYEQGKHIGDTKMTQLTFGLQLGGQAYSQMIFFIDERALKEFTSGNFEFGAQATAVAITASASASATTTGTGAGAGTDEDSAKAKGTYTKGMAVFTIAKGGLMYEASIGGQKFNYKGVE